MKQGYDQYGTVVPLCDECAAGRHTHLEWLHDRYSYLHVIEVEVIEKRRSLFQVLRGMNDCKVTNEDGKQQCCCRVGIP